MAIPAGNFSLVDVKNEFGTSTYNDDISPNESLSVMHNHIFGNAVAGSKLSNFASKARAFGLINGATNIGFDNFTANVTGVDYNGVFNGDNKGYGWCIIYSDDLNTLQNGNPSATATKTTTGSDSITVSNLSPGTTYYWKIQVWNAFHYKVNDRLEIGEGLGGSNYGTTTTATYTCSTIDNFNQVFLTFFGTTNSRLSWDHPANGSPNYYDVLLSKNGGSYVGIGQGITGTSFSHDVSSDGSGTTYKYQIVSHCDYGTENTYTTGTYTKP